MQRTKQIGTEDRCKPKGNCWFSVGCCSAKVLHPTVRPFLAGECLQRSAGCLTLLPTAQLRSIRPQSDRTNTILAAQRSIMIPKVMSRYLFKNLETCALDSA